MQIFAYSMLWEKRKTQKNRNQPKVLLANTQVWPFFKTQKSPKPIKPTGLGLKKLAPSIIDTALYSCNFSNNYTHYLPTTTAPHCSLTIQIFFRVASVQVGSTKNNLFTNWLSICHQSHSIKGPRLRISVTEKELPGTQLINPTNDLSKMHKCDR